MMLSEPELQLHPLMKAPPKVKATKEPPTEIEAEHRIHMVQLLVQCVLYSLTSSYHQPPRFILLLGVAGDWGLAMRSMKLLIKPERSDLNKLAKHS